MQTVFNFTFNESDIINNIELNDKIKAVYIYSDNKKCFKYCINFVINIDRPVKVKLFRTGKMSICGLKSLQEHETVNMRMMAGDLADRGRQLAVGNR